jgi:hypothetical protein
MHYHFEGYLTARDCKRHIPHPFTVPVHSGELDICLRFAPYRVRGISNMITLSLFDPTGFRGAGHRGGDSHMVHIASAEATPGYLPGPLPAGTWDAQIDTHMVMPGEPVHYRLDITITEDASAGDATALRLQALPRRAPPRGAGWYRGDLHTHTNHSDANGHTVGELIQTARDHGLDFIFLTDHNTNAGLAEMEVLAAPDLLACAGIELTTFWGHALCLGTLQWVDWRVRPGSGDMARLAAAAEAGGQIFVISHPQAEGDPACTGCTWRYGDMMPGNARLVEVWNGPWGGDSNNEAALALWYDWLNQGLRLVATAGTDTHSARAYAARPGFNVVYAEALSEAALLKALRAGHLYLSAGPHLDFHARGASGERWLVGDTVAGPVTFALGWSDCPTSAQVRVLANGRLLDQWPAAGRGEHGWGMAPEQANWVLAEVRAESGELLAVTNPIFICR